MDSLSNMNKALAYIEEHLTEEIDYSEVSKIAYCSEYHFKRMFSFLSGIGLSEYIRRRRLTLAALDLKDTNLRIIDVAVKYGYDSADSFSRAFHSMHGILPSNGLMSKTQAASPFKGGEPAVHHERAVRALERLGILCYDVAKPKKECGCQRTVFTNSQVGTKIGGRPVFAVKGKIE